MSDILTGNYVSDTQLASDVLSTDLFVCVQKDKYVCTDKHTVAVQSQTIASKLVEMIADIRKFGTMLNADTEQYSQRYHNHDDQYNKLSIDFYPGHPSTYSKISKSNVIYEFNGYPISRSKIDSYLSIGNLFVDGTLSTVYLPMSCVNDVYVVPWQIVEPEIGTIKIGVVQQDGDIDYKSDDFDGWLYPDGSTYELSDFSLSSKLSDVYGNDDGTFTLPTLSNFIRLNGHLVKNPELTSLIEGRNALLQHSHDITIDATGTITTVGTTYYSDGVELSGKGDTIHRGTGYWWYDSKNHKDFLVKRFADPAFNNDATIKAARKAMGFKNTKITESNKSQFLAWVDRTLYHSGDITLTCTCSIAINNIQILDSIDENETYPDYFDVPIMIYVGRRSRQ